MKALLSFFILAPLVSFGQTLAERKIIMNSSDGALIEILKYDAKEFYSRQSKLISEYKKQHFFVESEYKSLQRIDDDGTPIFYTVDNQGSAVTLAANKLYPGGSMGLSVTGQGLTAGVWDGGKVRDTHVEFVNKITLSDGASTLSPHSTHVTGTILATGVSALRRGIAYQAVAQTYDYDNDYQEMLLFGGNGYLVSNHSYGYITSSFPTAKFGTYDTQSIQFDNLANAYPYYQIVKAAGNDRSNTDIAQVNIKGGYDLLNGASTSKNVLTVAAVEEVPNYLNANSVVMSSFSNYGPTDDGRIKPDIAAKGVDVSSCGSLSNNQYIVLQGTSMATPAITGLVLLLQKHYNNLNAPNFMRSSTVRGIICHSAREAGAATGPDYEFGWGLPNAELAANIITNRNTSSILEENTLANNQTFTKQVSISSTQKLQVTICWTDPTGSANVSGDEDNRTPRLKNNLDLKILKDGNTYYPWKLNPDDPMAPATNTADNDVDNIEKVEIPNAAPGVYTIQVTHKGTLTGSSQVFSLIANGGGTGLGLDTRDYDNSIFIYPNPASTVLNFDLKNDITISGITVNDISGKELFKTSGAMNNAIDVSNLSAGVYFVTFTSDNNSVTKKFIKQ